MPSLKKIRNIKDVRKYVERRLNKLPAWRRKYIYETKAQKEYVLRNMVWQVEDAIRTGKNVNVYNAFMQQSSQGVRAHREGTLRDVFKSFKREESILYNKYNSYMYRAGYKATEYFYNPDNSTINDEGYFTTIQLELPSGKRESYTFLNITIDWRENEIVNADMI